VPDFLLVWKKNYIAGGATEIEIGESLIEVEG
jgi:hypothetical protein